ncbi:WYL domain-containing protein [Leptolyngbya sp. FACHB-36]|uniref:helix-turn-helix transcriptional regulator n=1 Tax=Leptolyngbya sp. FACHB-36 TaxID=2692808 RepID=UPI00168184BB|nr:WYL domain-containing protein [Leptolyngbya sp. FACHB-36]MBD2019225.1 WYL domain-containing protein [Leptolyngbya sp. FACHB-36]
MLLRLERLLQLDDLLRRQRQRHTAGSLAVVLEVNERTVRNDLNFLRDRYHAPIDFNRQKGYYYTDPDWRLPSITLSKGELFALILGARMLEANAGSAYAPELRSALTRLSERLPQQSWVDLQQVADERILFRSGAEIDLNPEIWHRLEDACRLQMSVQMTYYTASSNSVSERKFDPYLLHIYRGTNPYAIGYCHKRQGIRWFRVDRIKQLQVLEETFVPDPTFDAKDHLEMIFQHEAGGVPLPVSIWFDAPTAPYIRERRWHPTQELQEHPDGSVTLHMVVRGLNDLKRWVLGYGRGAIVRQPPELVEMVKAEVVEMNEQYLES